MKTPEQLEPVSWDEIKDFYKQNFGEILKEDWKEAFCYAWSQSRKMPVIDLLATGYRACQHHQELNKKSQKCSCLPEGAI